MKNMYLYKENGFENESFNDKFFLSKKSKIIKIIVLLFVTLLYISNVSAQNESDIGAGYFNDHIFADFTTPSTTGSSSQTLGPIIGNIGGNGFTITFNNTGVLRNYYNFTDGAGAVIYPTYRPSNMPTNHGWPNNTKTVDLNWTGTLADTASYLDVVFDNNLDIYDHLHIIDIDTREAVKVEFYSTASGGTPLNIAENIQVVKLSNTSYAPQITYPTPYSVVINEDQAIYYNTVDQGYSFVVMTTNVKRIRIYQVGDNGPSSSTHTWDFTFSKGAPDRGDAPSTYGDAEHVSLHNLLRLGDVGGDSENSPNYSLLADGDNINGIDDEDGVQEIIPIFLEDSSSFLLTNYQVSVNVTNNYDSSAKLIGWIDWNNNGVFESSEASIPIVVPTNTINGVYNLVWNDVTVNNTNDKDGTYLRVRLSSGNLLTESNPVNYIKGIGEVEDYFIPYMVNISGTVFNDFNGNTIIESGEYFSSLPTVFYVYLIDDNGIIVDSNNVETDGSYELIAQSNQNYTISFSTISYPIGTNVSTNPINTDPPLGWVITGENGNNNTGSGDGLPDGNLDVSVGISNVFHQNFGIQRPPIADDKTYIVSSNVFSPTPPIGYPNINTAEARYFTISTDNSGLTGYTHNGSLTGHDAEDCPTLESCNTGSVFVLDSLYSTTRLFYNYGGEIGVRELAEGDTISNYDPSKLVIYALEGSGMGIPVGFTYSIVDAAGFASPPASYVILTGSALPVELIFFEATSMNCSILLNWATASELNNNYFEVERSENGFNWEVIGSVQGHGTTNVPHDYQFVDRYPLTGISYYRLRQVDFDGQFEYSPVRSVENSTQSVSVKRVVWYPNPTNGVIRIVNSELFEKVEITDVLGRRVMSLNKLNDDQINLNQLIPGAYLIHFVGNNYMQTDRVIVQ